MPPVDTAGACAFACSAPPIDAVPFSGGAASSACAVTITCVALWTGCQVADQRPSFSGANPRGVSPLENDAVRFPDTIGLPQSSTTVTSIAVGHAATVAKP